MDAIRFYRTFSWKLLLLISLFTCAVAVGASWSIYDLATQRQTEDLKQRLISQAVTAASFVDGGAFARLQQAGQHGDGDWQQVATALLRFRTGDPTIKFIYTMARTADTEGTGELQFVVDPTPDRDEDGDGVLQAREQAARLGARYAARQLAPRMLAGFAGPVCDDQITEDQWGATLSGYAPIRDGSGAAVGVVGVDMSADHIRQMQRKFVNQCAVVVAAVMAVALLVSMSISWYVNQPVKALHQGISSVQEGNLETRVVVRTNDEFRRLADAFNEMTKGLKEREFMRGTLDRYMSKELAQVVLNHGEAFFTTAERRHLTVLFCDLKGMTKLSEHRSPEEVVRILSRFFDHMIEAVFRHGGIVDKLLGDGLMAVFGAPVDLENHEGAAVECALDMNAAMDQVRRETGLAELGLGVGINTGWVVAGNLGSSRRIEYTVIGDVVNVASRVQSETRHHDNADVLISATTAAPLQALYSLREIGPVTVRNREEPVLLFAVEGRKKAG